MEMKIRLIGFNTTKAKVTVGVEVEEVSEKYLPEIVEIVRSGKVITICTKTEEEAKT